MALRTLEKRIRVGGNEEHSGDMKSFELEYYLLESEADNDDAANNRTIYGIEIVKKTDGGCVENSRFEGIFTDKSRTRELIGTLASNTVTPVSLPYILDDLLGI